MDEILIIWGCRFIVLLIGGGICWGILDLEIKTLKDLRKDFQNNKEFIPVAFVFLGFFFVVGIVTVVSIIKMSYIVRPFL